MLELNTFQKENLSSGVLYGLVKARQKVWAEVWANLPQKKKKPLESAAYL